MVWDTGVVVTADSRASGGYIMHEETKIYPIYQGKGQSEIDLAVVGGSGNSALVKQGASLIEKEFLGWLRAAGKRRNPNDEELDEIVATLEARFMARYADLRNNGISVDTELLLASLSSTGKPRLYVFDDHGIANPLHKVPGYALLGMGSVTGGQLLLRLLGYSPGYQGDLGLLSAFVLDAVSEIDPSVSPFLGDSLMIRFDENRQKVSMGPLTAVALKSYKANVSKRREMLMKLWQLADLVGEDEVFQKLESLFKRSKLKEAEAGSNPSDKVHES